ncbi:MAG: caspase family protein [Cyanobacteria bacterium P01_G01_bin.54]
MGLDRRTFLQQMGYWAAVASGSAIASPWARAAPALPAPQLLSQTLNPRAQRKLALLVGIDHYPHQPNLAGCNTDVQLQRELLIHRFGFVPGDIVTLTDQQASREAIETTFTEHLVKQAKPGDQVVFHFSGYGTQVHLPDTAGQDASKGEWVNALLPQDGDSVEGVSNCLLEQTLLLLIRSLATRQCTVILDAAYAGLGQTWQGAWRSRSNPDLSVVQPSQAELAVRQQLQLNRPRKLPHETLQWSSLPVSLISSVGAVEVQWQGFSVGLLTATLTQWLWAMTEPTASRLTLTHLQESLEPLTEQTPLLEPATTAPLPYTQTPTTTWGAEGYIQSRSDAQTVILNLAGLSAEVWARYGLRSQFQVLDAQGQSEACLELRSKSGRQSKAVLISGQSELATGQLVQEWVRCLPRNLGLAIALDHNLQRIERVDATSVLAGVSTVSTIALGSDHPVDYLFAKRNGGGPITLASSQKSLQKSLSRPLGYGLFSAGGRPIPKTSGNADEAVIVALNRIIPAFDTLLASKWWRLLVNETASQLAATVTLELLQEERSTTLVAQHYSRRFPATPAMPVPLPPRSIPLGSQVCYTLSNPNEFPLYALILTQDAQGSTSAFATLERPLSQPNIELAPQSQLVLPSVTTERRQGIILRSPGLEQVYVFFSRQPWRNASQVLAQNPPTEGMRNRFVELQSPLHLTQALLNDLHQASLDWDTLTAIPPEHYALHHQVWAGFRIVYTVA